MFLIKYHFMEVSRWDNWTPAFSRMMEFLSVFILMPNAALSIDEFRCPCQIYFFQYFCLKNTGEIEVLHLLKLHCHSQEISRLKDRACEITFKCCLTCTKFICKLNSAGGKSEQNVSPKKQFHKIWTAHIFLWASIVKKKKEKKKFQKASLVVEVFKLRMYEVQCKQWSR